MINITAKEHTPLQPHWLSLLAIVIGIVTGIGALVFRGLIGFFHNLLFLGQFSFHYDASVYTPASPWGPFVVLVPVVGALIVVFLVQNFAPEAKGHGVPEVMDAIYYNRGVIRPVVAVVKSLASAISIGSGGSVGREGPIVQIGSSFGSTLGQLLRLPTSQCITLIAAGAGSGIAATFNTPIGGVLFAIELILHEVSARTLVPVALATATATYIGRIFFGDHPSFVIPTLAIPYFAPTNPWLLICYAVLGILAGLVSMVYVKSVYWFEDQFDQRIGGSYYRRHLLGMFLVGILSYALYLGFGQYYVEGVGYATIQQVLTGAALPLTFLFALAGLKMLATGLTLGSGASGGIFSPALFIGATLGGGFGLALKHLFPGLQIDPAAFAVVGMAGVVGAATGAAVTAIVMVFEMTLDYNVILPMTAVVAVSYGLQKAILKDTIYTLKLSRRGHYMPVALQTNRHFLRPAREFMDRNFGRVAADSRVEKFVAGLGAHDVPPVFLVEEQGRIYGFITWAAAILARQELPEARTLHDLASKNFIVVAPDTTLLLVMAGMRSNNAEVVWVSSSTDWEAADKVEGAITKGDVATALEESVALFSDQ